MISRPCRISLQTGKISSRSLPNTSLGDELCHRRGNFSPLQHRCASPDIPNVNNHAYASPDVKVKPEAQPCQAQRHSSLRLIGRLSLINNTNTNFNSKTPRPQDPKLLSRSKSSLATCLSETFLPTAKQIATIRSSILLISFQIPTRNLHLLVQRQFACLKPWRRSISNAHLACLWSWKDGYARLVLTHISRADQSSILHDAADRDLMIYLLSSSQSEKSLTVIGITPRNAQCIVIVQRSHSGVSNVLDHSSL